MESDLRDRRQELLEISSTCSQPLQQFSTDNALIITNIVAGMEEPSCSFNKESITRIKKEKASLAVNKRPLRNRKFTKEEDEYLKEGITKYGRKNWASVLKDDHFNFHVSRKRDSLQMHADSAVFERLYSHS